MIRFFARFWAKRQYIWREEITAALNDLNAVVSEQRAKDKRDLITQLNKEADEIEKNIARIAEMEVNGFWRCENGHEDKRCDLSLCREHEEMMCSECKAEVAGKLAEVSHSCQQCGKPAKFIKHSEMSGQEKYESDQERKDAEQVAQSKRDYATKQLPEEIKGQDDTAKHFRRQAASSRELADRLKRL